MVNTDAQRVRGYRVLARLLEDGAAGVPAEIALVFDATADPQSLRSEYVAAFDLGVPPYASAFLEADRCVGGRVTATLADRMETGATAGPAACHLAVQLEFVARRLEAGHGDEAVAFVRDAVLSWLPAFAVVLREQPVPFWRAVVSQALDLASDHVAGRAAGLAMHSGWMSEGLSTPLRPADVPPPLQDSDRLADVAVWLTTPAAVGTFISDADVVALGRSISIPRGFGSRPERMETLLRSAADYGCVPAATDGLGALLDRRRSALRALGKTHVDPGLLAPWVERLEVGLDVVARLGEASAGSRPAGASSTH